MLANLGQGRKGRRRSPDLLEKCHRKTCLEERPGQTSVLVGAVHGLGELVGDCHLGVGEVLEHSVLDEGIDTSGDGGGEEVPSKIDERNGSDVALEIRTWDTRRRRRREVIAVDDGFDGAILEAKVGRSCIGNRTNAIRSGGRTCDSTSEVVRWGACCRNDGNAGEGEGEGDELEELHCWY